MKPIIATTLSGLFIRTSPWKDAHRKWFEQIVRETGDESFRQWAMKPGYFEGVNLAMAKLMPDASKEERIREARRRFMEAVVDNIKERREEVVNREAIDFFSSLKEKFTLALITTNTKEAAMKILSIAGIENLFDIAEFSMPGEEDDKSAVIERFMENHGKPRVYFGGDRKDIYDYCRQKNIFCVFANLEDGRDFNARTVHTIKEMEEIIQGIQLS